MAVKVDVKELDNIINRIKKLQGVLPGSKGGISAPLKKSIELVGKKILEILKKETPVSDPSRPDYHENSEFHKDKTPLKNSWKWKVKHKGAVIEGFAFVTPGKLDNLVDLLEAGSPKHPIAPVAGGVLRFYARKGGGWEEVYSRKVINHPGFPPNKFIDRAKVKSKVYITELRDAVQSEINSILLGK